jgi:hypothetical protein
MGNSCFWLPEIWLTLSSKTTGLRDLFVGINKICEILCKDSPFSRVPLVEQELLTLMEHLSLPPVFNGVCVIRSLVLYVCFVGRCLSFFFWSLCCLIYGFCLPVWYIQTLLIWQCVHLIGLYLKCAKHICINGYLHRRTSVNEVLYEYSTLNPSPVKLMLSIVSEATTIIKKWKINHVRM